MGAGSDNRHFTAQHVQQLRQFVDARAADDPADPGNPVVVLAGRTRARRIELFHAHRAEFEDREEAVAPAGPLLDEHHRPAIFQLDQQRHERKQRCQGKHGASRQGGIKRALDGSRSQSQRPAGNDQGAEPAFAPRADHAKAADFGVDDLAGNVGALEYQRPCAAPVGRAADHDAVHVHHVEAKAVHHVRVGKIGREVMFACINVIGVRDAQCLSAVIDHEHIDTDLAAAAPDQRAHQRADPDQQHHAERQSEEGGNAREIVGALGGKADKEQGSFSAEQRHDRPSLGKGRPAQCLQRTDSYAERDGPIDRNENLAMQERPLIKETAKVKPACRTQPAHHRDAIQQQQRDINLQPPLLERRGQR